MTLVKIDKADKEVVEKTLAGCLVSCRFYTIENNELMLQCEIDSDSPSVLWSLGKMTGMQIIHDAWVKTGE